MQARASIHAALALVALGAGVRVISALLAPDSNSERDTANEERQEQQQVDVEVQVNLQQRQRRRSSRRRPEETAAFEQLDTNSPSVRMRLVSNPTNTECTICLETMRQGSNVRVTPCNHVLHASCLKRWVLYSVRNYRRPLCPNCLGDLGIDAPNPPPTPPRRQRHSTGPVLRIVINPEFAEIPRQFVAEDAYVRLLAATRSARREANNNQGDTAENENQESTAENVVDPASSMAVATDQD